MNAKPLILVASLVFAAGASAQEATSDAWMNVASTKSRAEVRADAQGAASVAVSGGEASLISPRTRSTADRDAVRADARADVHRFQPGADIFRG